MTDQTWPDEAREAVRAVVAHWDTKTVLDLAQQWERELYEYPRAAELRALTQQED